MKRLIPTVLVFVGLIATTLYSPVALPKDGVWRKCVTTPTPEGYCAMTAGEKKRACKLGADTLAENGSSPEWQRAFLRKCATNKNCEFIAHFYAAQDKRRQGATPVGVFSRQWSEHDQHLDKMLIINNQRFENFLKDYPFLRNDVPQITQAGIAEVRGNVNLLFVLYPDQQGRQWLQVYVDRGDGYKKAILADKAETMVENVSFADGEVSLFFFRGGGKIGPVPSSVEYTLGGATIDKPENMSEEEWGRTFWLTEPHEGC
ncbi:hypothetical protein [Bradyrhizobium sp.]